MTKPEIFLPTKHWEITDRALYPDGTIQLLREVDYNTVVNSCSVLLASLVKAHNTGFASKYLYLAVGSGSVSWSDDLLPAPSEATTILFNEVFRKAVPLSNIAFITSGNVVTETPTNRLQISMTLEEDEGNFTLMEFGLFGGPNVSGTKDTGIMLNHKIHSKIVKTNAFKLLRTIRLTF